MVYWVEMNLGWFYIASLCLFSYQVGIPLRDFLCYIGAPFQNQDLACILLCVLLKRGFVVIADAILFTFLVFQ